eukprot:g6292.t1
MESLRYLLKKKVAFVSSDEHDCNPPTDAQLASFLRNLTAETGLALRGAPTAVREMVREKFAEAGWDVRTNTATRDEPPTVDELQAFLEGTLEALDAFEPEIDPTDEELEDPRLACQRLWDMDTNRLTPEDEYAINLQSGKKPYHEGDRASEPLFTYVKPFVFEKPTYATFLKLLDNYTAAIGSGEVVTGEERAETIAFIDAIMATPCMQYVHKYLAAKGQAPESETGFKNLLHQTWFELYSRARGSDDSSGFEHVFVGESKRGEITGLHNWIQIYSEEKHGRLDYLGYIFPRQRGYEDTPAEDEQLITVQFEWNGELKNISSAFVGVSPEFEMGLYTLLFLLDKEKTTVDLGPYKVQVTTYIFRDDGKSYIGSAFPAEA